MEKKEENKIKEKDAQKRKTIEVEQQEYNNLKEEAAKAKQYWERIVRLQADFDNARKRMERQIQDYARYANEEIIVELLNVLDDLERAVQTAQARDRNGKNFEIFLRGIEMVLAHLYEMLKRNGLVPIESLEKPFDPHLHEALMQQETDKHPEDTVIEELQKGYLLNGKVIRTAKVKIAKYKKMDG